MARQPVLDGDLETGAEFEDETVDNDTGSDDSYEAEDDAEIDDNVDDESDEEGEDEPVEEAPRQPTRGENRVARATREAKEAKEAAEALRAEIAALKQPAQTQQRETAEQRQARLNAMDPEDRVLTIAREDRDALQAQLNEMRFNNWNTGDKADFRSQCATNKAFASVASDVEKEISSLIAKGQAVPNRETIATFLIGKRAIARGAGAKEKQGKAAEAAKQRESARPTNSRGDVRGEGKAKNERDARRKRLDGVNI